MDAKFWHQRWQSNETGFHESQANSLLVANLNLLSVARDERVFLPLCGKTLDIAWLLSKGYRVAGAELSELAVKQLFEGLAIDPIIADAGKLKHYSASGLDLYCGDIFQLDQNILGTVDAVYDRAALVALPLAMRHQYSKHVTAIAANARQLVITFEYDQSAMQGPPFSISADEVYQHYKNNYKVTALASRQVEGGLKGICSASETAWLLAPV